MIVDLIKRNLYQDSVALMQIAAQLKARPGIADASLMMGTPPNKEILQEARLLTAEGESAAPNDLIVALSGTEEALVQARAEIDRLLEGRATGAGERAARAPQTLADALDLLPDANLVLISTPGLYAAAEARKALHQGRHVMIFSDNVPVAAEQELKRLAVERDLLVMGPDCGTAIISGVPLGFANVVRRGAVGVVGASGTGMQEITCLVDRYGAGISQAIGTGSHDLSRDVGGMMTIQGLRALFRDPATAVVVLVSKPPHPEVAARVLAVAAEGDKPVVVIFLGTDPVEQSARTPGLTFAGTLEEAAALAVARLGGMVPAAEDGAAAAPAFHPTPQQRHVRGLFSGGTFCAEALLILTRALGDVYSNIPLRPELRLADLARSTGHTCLDMGDDAFTVGRPHPMIDTTARVERILAEAADPTVAVILLDVVLGYGAAADPAGSLAAAVWEARAAAAAAGRDLAVVASVCGTPSDPQGLAGQRTRLREAGAILSPSNAAAARLAAALAGPAAPALAGTAAQTEGAPA
jgi:succinyl-CoA synthetase alpha subunit